jgi:hypothetical protein
MIRHNLETDIIFWPTRFLNGEYLFYLWTARQLFLAPSQKYRNISKSCSDEVFEDLTTEILLSANCQSNLAEYHPIDTYMNMCVRFRVLCKKWASRNIVQVHCPLLLVSQKFATKLVQILGEF